MYYVPWKGGPFFRSLTEKVYVELVSKEFGHTYKFGIEGLKFPLVYGKTKQNGIQG